MNGAYFNLYGMRFLVTGDVDEAYKRAHLAQKLMYQTKMMNVNNLDIIQNNLRLADGTSVYVRSQHGVDTAQIHVPPDVSDRKQQPLERIITTYIPAFEVSIDGGSDTIGYVLARGEGWNPQYDFYLFPSHGKDIPETLDPLNEADCLPKNVDPFSWGQWLEQSTFNDPYNGTNCPFNDLNEFLRHKFVLEIDKPDEVCQFYDVPPVGTVNRAFDCTTNQSRLETALCEYPYILDCPQTDYPDYAQIHNFFDVIWKFRSLFTYAFSIGEIGESGAVPPYHPSPGTGYQPLDTVIEEDVGTITAKYDAEEVWSGGMLSFVQPNSTEDSYAEQVIFLLNENETEMIADAINDIESIGCDVDSEVEKSVIGGWNKFFIQLTAEGSSIYGWTASQNITHSQYHYDYETKYSSVQDAEHYGILYTSMSQVKERSCDRTRAATCPWMYTTDELPISWDTETRYEIKVNISGSVFSFGFFDHYIYAAEVRYYRVGQTEIFMGYFSPTAPYTYVYFFAEKKEDVATISFTTFPNSQVIPGVTTQGGDPICFNGKFRLIREDKIIREEY